MAITRRGFLKALGMTPVTAVLGKLVGRSSEIAEVAAEDLTWGAAEGGKGFLLMSAEGSIASPDFIPVETQIIDITSMSDSYTRTIAFYPSDPDEPDPDPTAPF